MFLHLVVELVEGEVVGEFHGATGGVGEELAVLYGRIEYPMT